jgi:hypothetical protein
MAAGSPNYDDIDSTNVTVRKKREGIRIRKKGRMPIRRRRRNEDIQEEEENEEPLKEEEMPRKGFRESILDQSIGTVEDKKKRLSETRQKLITEAKSKEVINDAIKGYKARKEASQLKEEGMKELRELKQAKQLREEQADEIEEEVLIEKQKAFSNAKKLLTRGMIRYKAMKDKKAWEKKAKETLEAAIDAMELKVISQSQEEPNPSEKSQRIKKAFESITDFWLADTLKEAAIQAKKDEKKAKKKAKEEDEARKKDEKQAKKKAQEEAEARIGLKSQALREKREQLEAQGKK